MIRAILSILILLSVACAEYDIQPYVRTSREEPGKGVISDEKYMGIGIIITPKERKR